MASRGIRLQDLSKSGLWQQGPLWLLEPSSSWPSPELLTPDDPSVCVEVKKSQCHHVQLVDDLISRFSNLVRLNRVVARCLLLLELQPAHPRSDISRPLSVLELEGAFLRCVRLSQNRFFAEDIQQLSRGDYLPKTNRLSSVFSFVDRFGTLRVRGRLQASSLPFTERHPPILYKNCHLSLLLTEWAHKVTLHGGASLTFSMLSKRVWMIGGRKKTREVVRRCAVCVRARARTSNQLMGSLPSQRVRISRPFSKIGIDYAGPILTKAARGRGIRTSKGYIAAFVCLSTKAVHLETVSDLTTATFLAALRRVSSRRGPPNEIWSDNATTFHGADVELRAMFREAQISWDSVTDSLANQGITWRFIPPSAPHFGGLWEAAVKSAKTHLKKVIGQQVLTYEEMSTLLC